MGVFKPRSGGFQQICRLYILVCFRISFDVTRDPMSEPDERLSAVDKCLVPEQSCVSSIHSESVGYVSRSRIHTFYRREFERGFCRAGADQCFHVACNFSDIVD